MSVMPPVRRNGRAAGLALAAALLAACGGKQPPGPVAPPPSQLPADHPALAAPTGPQSRVPPGTVLATVGEQAVTAGDVEAALAGMPNADRLGYATPQALRELVEALADRRLMAGVARAEGLAADPVMKEMLGTPPPGADPDQMLAEVWLETELAKSAAPTAADAERYYRENPAEFTEPARVRVTRVTSGTEAGAERARAELARGATPEGAEQLWLQAVPRAPEATAVALGLDTGGVSPVLPAAGGYLVMRAEEKAPPRLRALDEVRPGILAQLEDRRRQEALALLRPRLRKGVDVRVDDAAVAAFLGAGAAGQ